MLKPVNRFGFSVYFVNFVPWMKIQSRQTAKSDAKNTNINIIHK